MSIDKQSQYRRYRRTNAGQALIESACGTIVFVLVFILLVMLGMNAYVVITTDTVLRLISMEAAKVREEYTFFLGQKRTDIQEATARQIATDFAVALGNANGLAIGPSDVTFNDTINADQAGTKCTIRLRALRLPYGGGVFPLALQREISTVVARMNVPAPALVDLNASGEGGSVTIQIPSYGAYRPLQTATVPNGRFATNRPDLFQATSLPGVPLPGPIKHRYYYGVAVGQNARVLGPIQQSTGQYVTPELFPTVGQSNISLPR